MKLDTMVTGSYEAFNRYAPGASVVLLHPRSRYRSVLVARLLNNPEFQTLYYAMGPDDTSVPAFLAGLRHDLASQHPEFGHNLNLVQDRTGKMEQWLDALAADLNEWTASPFLLILDEYDRSDSADDIQQFIEQLIPRMPTHGKIIINSRTLPRLPWVSLIAQKKAVILRYEQLVASNFYDMRESGGQMQLRVNALGPGYVYLDGEAINTWEGHLPRLLFFFALDRPVVTRSEICQAFWPDLENDQAVNVFHVTKRRLHKALNFDVLVHDGGYYRVNPEVAVQHDITEFVGALVRGRMPETEDKASAWQKAIDLYRGPFLQGHSDQWIVERRAQYQQGYLEALSEMARIRLAEGRQEHALGLLLRAVGENDRYEPIHRQIMQLYADLGRRSEAAAHYQNLLDQLKQEGKTPEAETQTLYTAIIS